MLTLLRIASDVRYAGSTTADDAFPYAKTKYPTARLATGRSALFYLLKDIILEQNKQQHTVFMPAYVAEGVIKPFLLANINIIFYELNDDLTPNIFNLIDLFKKNKNKAILVIINYFGFSANWAELMKVISEYHPVVINDCAHAPFSRDINGDLLSEMGDFTLYSLNKVLPVTDGAMIFSKDQRFESLYKEKDHKTLPEAAIKNYESHLRYCKLLRDGTSQVANADFLTKLNDYYQHYYNIINSDLQPYRQSERSTEIERDFAYSACIKQRISNAQRVYDNLLSGPLTLLHPMIPQGIVPFALPVIAPVEQLDRIYKKLFECGVLLSRLDSYWNFIPTHDSSQYQAEEKFLKRHFLIPISEHILNADIDEMIYQINKL
jgi:dTDP-4-amino-4,6-dideoxygalactose transaminase